MVTVGRSCSCNKDICVSSLNQDVSMPDRVKSLLLKDWGNVIHLELIKEKRPYMCHQDFGNFLIVVL